MSAPEVKVRVRVGVRDIFSLRGTIMLASVLMVSASWDHRGLFSSQGIISTAECATALLMTLTHDMRSIHCCGPRLSTPVSITGSKRCRTVVNWRSSDTVSIIVEKE